VDEVFSKFWWCKGKYESLPVPENPATCAEYCLKIAMSPSPSERRRQAFGPGVASRPAKGKTPRTPSSEAPFAEASREAADLIVRGLAGSWRKLPPAKPLLASQLAPYADRLLEAGVGGLVWRCLTLANADGRDGLRALQQAYRLDALKAARHEEQIAALFDRFRAHEIDAVLCKGWSVARIYPETGLRPYCDIDLAVAPDRWTDAIRVLEQTPSEGATIDLHCGVPDLKSDDSQDSMLRSQLVALGNSQVRVLGAEDQLRQLCLHFWRHLGCRPLWLCDIAAALEAAAPTFDWHYCLRGKPAVADTILCVLGAAIELLEAQGPPDIAHRAASRLPGWLVTALLWRWSRGVELGPLWPACRNWDDFRETLLFGKFNPMRATERMRLSPHHPLLAIQAASLCGRPLQYGVRIWRRLKKLTHEPGPAFELHEDRVF